MSRALQSWVSPAPFAPLTSSPTSVFCCLVLDHAGGGVPPAGHTRRSSDTLFTPRETLPLPSWIPTWVPLLPSLSFVKYLLRAAFLHDLI